MSSGGSSSSTAATTRSIEAAKRKLFAELQTELLSLQQQEQQPAGELTRADRLRAELDWLREEEESDDDDDDNDDDVDHPEKNPYSWHPLVRRHRKLAQGLMQLPPPDDHDDEDDEDTNQTDDTKNAATTKTTAAAATAAAIAMYDQEIVESYQELVSLNSVLKDRLQMEEKRRDKLTETLEEYKIIHQLLVTERTKQQQQQQHLVQETTDYSETTSHSSCSPEQQEKQRDLLLQLALQEENPQLRDDLKYVTECIIQQNSMEWQNHNTMRTTPTAAQKSVSSLSSLHDVLWQLVDRRIAASENSSSDDMLDDDDNNTRQHPYVQVKDPYLLQLLQNEWHIVEPYDDVESSGSENPLVCLVDYLASEQLT